MTRVRLFGALLGAGLLLGLPVGVAQAQYPPATVEECVQTLDGGGSPQTTFAPGGDIIVAGESLDPARRCFDPNSSVEIWFIQSEIRLAITNADAQGNYSTENMGVSIPEGARAGSAQIEARGTLDGDAQVYSRAITISEVAPVLPVTGRDIMLLTAWGVGLVVLGSVLITATWRRWRAARFEAELAREAVGAPRQLVGAVDPRPYAAATMTTWADPPTVPEPLEEDAHTEFRPARTEEILDAEIIVEGPEPSVSTETEPTVSSEPTLEPETAEPVDEAPEPQERTPSAIERLQEEIRAWQDER